MRSATIVLMIAWLLASGAPRLASTVGFAQTAPTQQTSQPNATSPPAAPASPATAPKPCPAASPSSSAPQPDCKPASKSKKRHTAPAAPGSGPTKKVVRDGGANDTSSAISPGMNQQQLENTKGLLAKTDENLKILESRQLNAAQLDTLNQVKSYVKQSNAAVADKDVQRAYTLANKARMLSGDLVKH